jgi:transcriptional regulator with XRE-family HTH domain
MPLLIVRVYMTRIKELLMVNVSRLRKKKGLTQEQLAELCAVSTNHIAGIEIGRRFPSEELFQRIADNLGVEPYQLVIDPDSTSMLPESDLIERYTEFLANEIQAEAKTYRKKFLKKK